MRGNISPFDPELLKIDSNLAQIQNTEMVIFQKSGKIKGQHQETYLQID